MRGPTTSVVLIIAIFVSFTLSGTLAAAGEVRDALPPPVEPRPPTITVSLYQDEIEIATGPGCTGRGTLNGTVTVEKPREARAEEVLVSLHIFTSDQDVLGSIKPQVMEFGMNAAVQTQPFNLEFQVPPMIPSIHIDGTFMIRGNWSYKYYGSGGEIPETSGVVVLKPFCYIMGSMPNREKIATVPIGSWRTVEFEIKNNGNDRTTIYISEIGENENVDCIINDDRVTLNEGESVIIPVKVRINEGGPKPKIYEQGIRLEAKDIYGETVTYDTAIFIQSMYTPGSFFKSTLFKLIIAGLVAFAILVALLAIFLRRRRRRKDDEEADILL
ncbi:MAG: hypothetical protein ACMUHM_06430 [Thermoplasmatota archaeon]